MAVVPQSGRAVLEQYSDLERRRQSLGRFRCVLSIDDQRFDGEVMKGMLHVCLGHETEVISANSLAAGIDMAARRKPDLIFLDDYLGRTSTALESIAGIRKSGYDGPIVVVSALLSTKRRRELADHGATAAIHKDDLSSMSIAEVLLSID